jgi:hypothetical protein
MIHELRTYTLGPGAVPKMLKLVEEVGRPARGDDYGKMEGYWFTEHGQLNQVIHLWSHDDLNARQDNRARLSQNQTWVKEFLPQAMPLIKHQHVRLMHPKLPLKPPASGGNVYEYRYYRTQTGKAAEFAGHLAEAMPVRERYSQNVCLWHTEAGQPNEVSHLWVYKDLNTRMASRTAAGKDPDWQAFLGKGGPLLEEMHSAILIPAPFSPLN